MRTKSLKSKEIKRKGWNKTFKRKAQITNILLKNVDKKKFKKRKKPGFTKKMKMRKNFTAV